MDRWAAGPPPGGLLADNTTSFYFFLAALGLVTVGFGIGLLVRQFIPERVNPLVRFGASTGTRFFIAILGAIGFVILGTTETEQGPLFSDFETRLFLLTLAASYVVTLLVETIWIVPVLIDDQKDQTPAA